MAEHVKGQAGLQPLLQQMPMLFYPKAVIAARGSPCSPPPACVAAGAAPSPPPPDRRRAPAKAPAAVDSDPSDDSAAEEPREAEEGVGRGLGARAVKHLCFPSVSASGASESEAASADSERGAGAPERQLDSPGSEEGDACVCVHALGVGGWWVGWVNGYS